MVMGWQENEQSVKEQHIRMLHMIAEDFHIKNIGMEDCVVES